MEGEQCAFPVKNCVQHWSGDEAASYRRDVGSARSQAAFVMEVGHGTGVRWKLALQEPDLI
jgi:hypothetical protein